MCKIFRFWHDAVYYSCGATPMLRDHGVIHDMTYGILRETCECAYKKKEGTQVCYQEKSHKRMTER